MNKQIDLFRLSIIKGNAKNIKTSCKLRTQIKMIRGKVLMCVYVHIIKGEKNMRKAENNPASTHFSNFGRKYLCAFVYNFVVLFLSYVQ